MDSGEGLRFGELGLGHLPLRGWRWHSHVGRRGAAVYLSGAGGTGARSQVYDLFEDLYDLLRDLLGGGAGDGDRR